MCFTAHSNISSFPGNFSTYLVSFLRSRTSYDDIRFTVSFPFSRSFPLRRAISKSRLKAFSPSEIVEFQVSQKIAYLRIILALNPEMDRNVKPIFNLAARRIHNGY